LQEIARTVKLPVLRKDFTVSAYQIYQARLLGAAAVLLIVTLLSEARLREYLQLAASLHLAALVEAHTEMRK
jgi:indole-3-glycerol phosphate synthase